jgi:hypothetical protein
MDYQSGEPVEIYDMMGHVVGVYSKPTITTANEITIDISHLTNGVYFLRVGTKTVKVVKQ